MEKFEKLLVTFVKIVMFGFGALILYWGFYFIFFIIKTLVSLF